MSLQPLRSVLYMPGANERALMKAEKLAADALILDLEDAVAPDQKLAARDLVCRKLVDRPYGERVVAVRVNGLDTEWGEADLQAAAKSNADAILIPKVDGAEDVLAAEKIIHAAGNETANLWVMMETPLAMLNAAEIAAAHPRLSCFVMGTNDLVKELGAAHTDLRLPMVTSLGLCMLAARAHGLAIIDGVYNAFKDEDGLRVACQQGKEMGFDGKTLIHPVQLDIANDIFAPSGEEVALAHRYVEAFEEAQRAGQGVAVVDGKIVENLHVETAKKHIAQADAIERLTQNLT